MDLIVFFAYLPWPILEWVYWLKHHFTVKLGSFDHSWQHCLSKVSMVYSKTSNSSHIIPRQRNHPSYNENHKHHDVGWDHFQYRKYDWKCNSLLTRAVQRDILFKASQTSRQLLLQNAISHCMLFIKVFATKAALLGLKFQPEFENPDSYEILSYYTKDSPNGFSYILM